MNKRKQSGFTLIELIVVVGFVALLALGGTLIYVGAHFIGKLW